MKKVNKVSKEQREQIINRIKNDGISVTQASADHGVPPSIISGWLASKVTGGPTITEYAKLKRENQALKELVGVLTLEKTQSQKKT